MLQTLVVLLLFLTTVFMILLVLVQRGRGGGLVGALGGMGGQSAFGTKAGDMFTRITIVTAAVWIILSIAAYKLYNPKGNVFGPDLGSSVNQPIPGTQGLTPPAQAPATPAGETPAATAPAATPPATTAPATTPATPATPGAK